MKRSRGLIEGSPRRYHPDVNSNSKASETKFKEIQEAYKSSLITKTGGNTMLSATPELTVGSGISALPAVVVKEADSVSPSAFVPGMLGADLLKRCFHNRLPLRTCSRSCSVDGVTGKAGVQLLQQAATSNRSWS